MPKRRLTVAEEQLLIMLILDEDDLSPDSKALLEKLLGSTDQEALSPAGESFLEKTIKLVKDLPDVSEAFRERKEELAKRDTEWLNSKLQQRGDRNV